jgi:hypothetical protein
VIWLTWRQQRSEILVAALMLALVTAVLVPIGLHVASVYQADGLSACVLSQHGSCAAAIQSFTNRFEQLDGLFGWFNLLPGLLGILLAVPLVIELEHGTFRLAWTQSVTRRRWLTTKLAVIVIGALVGTLALTLLITWWRIPLDQLRGRMGPNVFDFEGIVPFAYTLFAASLVLAVGAVLRRAAPTFAVVLVGYLGLRIAIQNWARPHYEAALSKVWPTTASGPDLTHAWILSEQPSDAHGHPIHNLLAILRACSTPTGNRSVILGNTCVRHHGVYTQALYQPASRFWLFQGIETAIFAGLALTLMAFAAWWVTTRVS